MVGLRRPAGALVIQVIFGRGNCSASEARIRLLHMCHTKKLQRNRLSTSILCMAGRWSFP